MPPFTGKPATGTMARALHVSYNWVSFSSYISTKVISIREKQFSVIQQFGNISFTLLRQATLMKKIGDSGSRWTVSFPIQSTLVFETILSMGWPFPLFTVVIYVLCASQMLRMKLPSLIFAKILFTKNETSLFSLQTSPPLMLTGTTLDILCNTTKKIWFKKCWDQRFF